MARRIKVLQVIDHLDSGGAQSLLVDLVAGLDQERFELVVCSLRRSKTYVEILEKQGIKVVQLGAERFNPLKLFPLIRLIRREHIDVVHTHLTAARILGAIAGKMGGAKRIFSHDHSGDEYLQKHPILARLLLFPFERALMPFTDRIFAVSQATAQYNREIKKLPGEKLEVLYNWIDFGRFQQAQRYRSEMRSRWGIPSEAFVVGSVGRLSKQKGYRFFVEAAPAVLEKYPETVFLIAGDGPELTSLKKAVEGLGITHAFHFLGFVGEVERVYAVLDLFILTSIYEPFGLVLLEAMAAEIPLIATAVGGVSEIVLESGIGTLIPAQDSHALAEAIIKEIYDPRQQKRRLTKNKSWILDQFDRDRALRVLEKRYEVP